MKGKYWQDWGVLAAAAWLFVSPFVLGFAITTHPSAWVSWAAAVVLFILETQPSLIPEVFDDWVDAAVGAAVVASPWLFGFSAETVPAVNFVLTGLVILLCALSAIVRLQKSRNSKFDSHAAEL